MTIIDLNAKTNAHYAKIAAATKEKAIEFVEKIAIPYLVNCAENGNNYAVLSCPSDINYFDVRNALLERVTCYVCQVGSGDKIKVNW